MVDDLGAALVTVLLLHLEELLFDEAQDLILVGQDSLKLLDELVQIAQLVFNLLTVKASQLTQLHSKNRLTLDLAERKTLHQPLQSIVVILTCSD